MTAGDCIWTNARLATMCGERPYGAVEPGAIAVRKGRIAWVGMVDNLTSDLQALNSIDLGGRWVTPGLIDCHTHIVHGGNRAEEFEQRLLGVSYEEIARRGGGIMSTVFATRATDEDDLLTQALPRVDSLLAEGLATIEIKSGYGLDLETELTMLRAARRIATRRDLLVRTSFLGAHALPPEFAGRADDYIEFICQDVLPAVHEEGLADAVDGFCEGIAFSPSQIARIFDKARALDLPVKLHAEQLSNLGGAALAASYGALSADHLEYLDKAGIGEMRAAGTVAVLLPGAFYALGETKLPPIQELYAQGVAVALATDSNPGTSPLTSLLLTMNMACTLFRLTPEQALAGVTREAARALGLQEDQGTIEPGKRADLAVWDIDHPAELSYRFGFNPLYSRIFGGVPWQKTSS